MEDLRSGIEHLKQAKAHMSEANGIISDCISKLKSLEEENAELRDELDDWKGNAEGFQPDEYMKLPLDADGAAIRIGDKMDIDGDCMTVLGYRIHDDMLLLIAKERKNGLLFTPEPSRVRHFKLEPLDSWEKLEEDVEQFEDGGTACEYFGGEQTSCNECKSPCSIGSNCRNSVARDVLRRAKKLAGIEEEARND